jgi:hypothetical protein
VLGVADQKGDLRILATSGLDQLVLMSSPVQ